MANYGDYKLDLFEGDIYCIKELCKISLHTVLFNRWLGEMNFRENESSVPNIYYTQLDDINIDKDINNQVEVLGKMLEEKRMCKIILRLYADKKKGFLSFLTNPTYEGNWENWEFNYILSNNIESSLNEVRIRQYIFDIIEKCNGKIDYMPNFDVDYMSHIENGKYHSAIFHYTVAVEKINENDSIRSIFKDKFKK